MEEKVFGKVSWKQRKIAQLLEELDKGDVVLISGFSRLCSSLLECMEIFSIAVQKGIKIYTVKGNRQLDDTIQSKVMTMAFSVPSEIERDLISKRTRNC
jgi:DNA invertase Pin-like site-specific DNA recombinase